MDGMNQFILENVQPDDTVLDIGCGVKFRTSCLINNKIVSLDAWDKVNPDILLDLEINSLPFEENSFDIILMIDFIEHLSKDSGKKLLTETYKICKKKIILLTPLWWSDNSENVNNPELWCYKNNYDLHKSLWTVEDFKEWESIPQGQYYLGVWHKK
jgi:cyclopropane fatty-acyl-phospholipid synthase-like methyltransferase